MTFLKTLFRNKRAERDSLRRFVELEYRPSDRDAAYSLILRESQL